VLLTLLEFLVEQETQAEIAFELPCGYDKMVI
jgi:hypothetical protein